MWLMAIQEPRQQITMLCLLATFTAYVERVGFSIAYTAMAKRENVSEAVKGTVLSAFYWGYGLSQASCQLLQNISRLLSLLLLFLEIQGAENNAHKREKHLSGVDKVLADALFPWLL